MFFFYLRPQYISLSSCSDDVDSTYSIVDTVWVERGFSTESKSYRFTTETDFSFTKNLAETIGTYTWNATSNRATLYDNQGSLMWDMQFTGATAIAFETATTQVEYVRQ